MSAYIEDAEIDVDTNSNDQPVMNMILTGDFDTICKMYLESNAYATLTFELPRGEAEHLLEQLRRYLSE